MRQEEVEAKEETVHEGVFIHLNMYQITQMLAFTFK